MYKRQERRDKKKTKEEGSKVREELNTKRRNRRKTEKEGAEEEVKAKGYSAADHVTSV